MTNVMFIGIERDLRNHKVVCNFYLTCISRMWVTWVYPCVTASCIVLAQCVISYGEHSSKHCMQASICLEDYKSMF